jgi:hypothetical protein
MGGLHHIAFEVDDLESRSTELRAKGVVLLEEKPVDAGSLWINFLPPSYTRGIIVELVQPKVGWSSRGKHSMPETLSEAAAFESDAHPRATHFIRELLKLSPTLLRGQIALLIDRRGTVFWREASDC